MMASLGPGHLPPLATWAAVAGWAIGAAVMLRDWSDLRKRFLGVTFVLAAGHYLGLALAAETPCLELLPAALCVLAGSCSRRWSLAWWAATPSVLLLGFAGPVWWTVTTALVVTALSIAVRPLGVAVFISGSFMLALLLAELLPPVREIVTGPIYPVLAWAVVATQLYLPSWAAYRAGRRGEGHWLVT